ncbi:MAG TPA: MAPEG family protein [Rhizomicrobium sp.]|nr:MAPEG family protein [Rhizomicrobium sp.]
MHAASPAMLLTSVVTILAIILYVVIGGRVATMRGKHSVAAPATTGHPEFERAYRVQMNTLEQFPIFFPALWLATVYFTMIGWLAPALGLLWVIGRVLYMQAYMTDPSKRGLGFGISFLAQLALVVLAVIGIVMAWTVVTAT